MIEENEIKANEGNDWTGRSGRGLSRAKLGFTVAGLGIGGMLAYLISRNAREAKRRSKESQSTFREDARNVVDDQGTTQEEAALILSNLRDRGFEGSDEKLALALGRTAEELRSFNSRQETIDDDVIMKARGIAMHRGIRID